MFYILSAPQTYDAVRQSPATDTAARAAGDTVLRAHVDLYDIQRVALLDGSAGSRCWILSILLEEVGDCRCDGALPLAADQGRRRPQRRGDDPLKPAVSDTR